MNEQECLKYMEEEFVKGAEAMLHYIQDEGTGCNRQDNCVICNVGNKFLEMKRKALVDNFPKSELSEEREFVELKHNEMLLLKKALDIKETKCFYCKEEVKEGDKFGIFNKPTRIICNSHLCMAEAINDDDPELEQDEQENKQ